MPYKFHAIWLRDKDFRFFTWAWGHKGQKLWPWGEAPVLTLETRDQVHSAPMARDYHHIQSEENLFQLTRPTAGCTADFLSKRGKNMLHAQCWEFAAKVNARLKWQTAVHKKQSESRFSSTAKPRHWHISVTNFQKYIATYSIHSFVPCCLKTFKLFNKNRAVYHNL